MDGVKVESIVVDEVVEVRELKGFLDKARVKQETAANNYTVDRERLTSQVNKVIKQLANSKLTSKKRTQLERRLQKLRQGGRRSVDAFQLGGAR